MLAIKFAAPHGGLLQQPVPGCPGATALVVKHSVLASSFLRLMTIVSDVKEQHFAEICCSPFFKRMRRQVL
jgi:hypothetical protein